MRKLLPLALVLCSGFPLFAAGYPDTIIYIQKDTPLSHYTSIRLEWQLLIDGAPAQKGVFPFLALSSRHPTPVTIPARLPPGNGEVFLRLIYLPPGRPQGRPAPLLTRQILLRPWNGDYSIPPTSDISFSDSNDIFTITSANAFFQFDKQTGWLLAYKTNHLVLVDDSTGLRPAIWPSSVTRPHLQLFSTSTGSRLIIVRAEYTLPEVYCLLHMSYSINAAGEMLVSQSVETDTTRPDSATRSALPNFGMLWLLPPGFDSATLYAPPAASASTPTIFHAPLSSTPLTPIRWITITGADKKGIRIIADSSFLLLHSDGIRLHIDRPTPSLPFPSGGYQFSFKISPILPTQLVIVSSLSKSV